MKKWENKIYYSQCWEDPYVLLEGLDIQKEDKIISITSGGCNTLTLLLKDPKEVIALDVNPIQNYLLELKISAIRNFSYHDLLVFFGIKESRDRLKLYNQLAPHLSSEAQEWWKTHASLIQNGIIHCGKLERYFGLFRKAILPFIHSKKTVASLFTKRTKEQQLEFYEKTWNTWRWRLLFRIFFSKKATSVAARNPKLFEYLEKDNVSEYYLNKTKDAMCSDPWNNFILYYIFTGNYDKDHMPLYLKEENILLIRERLDKIRIISEDVETFLKKTPGLYTKYNLSNIFEACSSELTADIFKAITAHSNSGSRLVYINHMIIRTFSEQLAGQIAHDREKEEILCKKNMAFFYENIHIDYIK
jgi:S-adenosylmethionine-diacylglycerol 3-amino-3-carboxypropyl transferase